MSRVVEQFEQAAQYLAGGVSASTRVNRALGHALLFDRADGCRVWDLDGREYIDLCCSHGATLLGHGDARVRRAVEAALARGAACSYENELHTALARLGARFGVYFGVGGPVRGYRDAVRHQRDRMLRFVASAIRHGVYFHDYGGAACYHGFGAAMTPAYADEALDRLDGAVKEM